MVRGLLSQQQPVTQARAKWIPRLCGPETRSPHRSCSSNWALSLGAPDAVMS